VPRFFNTSGPNNPTDSYTPHDRRCYHRQNVPTDRPAPETTAIEYLAWERRAPGD